MADPLNSPFSAKPTQVGSPIPGDDELDKLLASMSAEAPPEVNVQEAGQEQAAEIMTPEAGVETPGQEIVAGLTGEAQPALAPPAAPDITGAFDELAEPEGELVSPEGGFIPGTESFVEQLKVLPDRIRQGLARNPEQLTAGLKKVHGDKNVKVKDGSFFIRRKGEKDFTELDPPTVGVIGDMVADNMRQMFRAGGASGGLAATGIPTGGAALLTPAGAGAFVFGAAAGDAFADFVGEQLFDLPRISGQVGTPDSEEIPDRIEAGFERLNENVQAGAFDALFMRGAGLIGTGVKRGGAYTKAKLEQLKIVKAVKAKWAAQRARFAIIKKAESVPEHKKLAESVKDNLDQMKEMEQLGYVENVPGSNLPGIATQVFPHTKQVQRIGRSVEDTSGFQVIQNNASKNMGKGVLNYIEHMAGIAKGTMQKVLRTNVPKAKPTLTKDFKALVKAHRTAQGKVIEKFRDKASSVARKQPIPSEATGNAVQDIMGKVGIKMQGGVLKMPKDDELAGSLGLEPNSAQFRTFKNYIGELNDMLTKGGLNVDEMLLWSDKLGRQFEGASAVTSKVYRAYMGKLSSSVRKDVRDGMGTILGEADGKLYNEAIAKFISVAESQESLKAVFKSEMGANTFANFLVNKGRDGLTHFRAAKTFLMEEDPKMLQQIKEEFFEQLAIKHRNLDPVTGINYNAKGIQKDLAKFGTEMLQELFPGKDIVKVNRALAVAQQFRDTVLKGSDQDVTDQAKKLLPLLSSFVSAKANALWSFTSFGTQKYRLAKLISKEGVDSMLERVPDADKGMMRKALNTMLQYARDEGAIATQALGHHSESVLRAKGGQRLQEVSKETGRLLNQPGGQSEIPQ